MKALEGAFSAASLFKARQRSSEIVRYVMESGDRSNIVDLGKRALLAQQRSFFPDAEVAPSRLSPAGLQACWKEFEELWMWRRKLLDQGWIECAVSGSDRASGNGLVPNSTAPIQRWQLEKYADPYNDFDALTGWEENA